MIDTLWFSAILISLMVPWILGTAAVSRLLSNTEHRNIWLIAGHGYLVGMVITTLIIRVIDFIGIGLGLLPITLAQIVLILALSFSIFRNWRPAPIQNAPGNPHKAEWRSVVTALLICLIALRLFTLTQEAMLRPLFAWDAWMNWVPKAAIYYHAGELAQFVSHEQWLNQASDTTYYTLGNYGAWKYPITVPLIQYWGMISVGNPDTPLAYLHWPMVSLALGLALFGHLRLARLDSLLSVLACYFLLSLPYLNTHTALVGYADIWLATAFGCGVMSLYSWRQCENTSYAVLAIIYAVTCFSLKVPGIVIGAILLACLGLSALRLPPKLLLAFLAGTLAIISTLIIIGTDVDLPLVGKLSVTMDKIELPLFGKFDLQFHAVHSAFTETLFLSMNWHLLWPVFLLALGSTILIRASDHAELLVLASIMLLLLFLLFVFYLTKHHQAAANFATLNRALLYAVPAIVFYIFLRAKKVVSRPADPCQSTVDV